MDEQKVFSGGFFDLSSFAPFTSPASFFWGDPDGVTEGVAFSPVSSPFPGEGEGVSLSPAPGVGDGRSP